MVEHLNVEITADTEPFAAALKNLQDLSTRFGTQLSGALRSVVVDGRDLETVLRRLATSLADMALNQGLQPLQSLLPGLSNALPFAKGGVVPFAGGGVVAAPSYFPMRGGTGLMGEAGAEAILPLQRGSDGGLGVASGGGSAPVNIVFNVTAADAASFRKSEAQVTGMLARAVSRGTRSL